jgi:hypothetical protein
MPVRVMSFLLRTMRVRLLVSDRVGKMSIAAERQVTLS